MVAKVDEAQLAEGAAGAPVSPLVPPPLGDDPVIAEVKEVREVLMTRDIAPEIPAALQLLHPVLLEALRHPMARAALDKALLEESTIKDDDERLSSFMGYVNESITRITNALQDPKAYLYSSEGSKIMEKFTYYCMQINGFSTVSELIMLALQTFAKTTLRQAYKTDTPFDEGIFQRELDIVNIIKDLLAGLRRGGNMDAPI